jgi:aminopeptidase
MIHIDWMIGSKDINIDGIKENNLIPVFRKGEWVN